MVNITTSSRGVPNIAKDSPIALEQLEEPYELSVVEKRGKVQFVVGILFLTFIVLTTFGIYLFWLKMV